MAKNAKKAKKAKKSMNAEDYPTVEEMILGLEEGFGVKLSEKDKRELTAQVNAICGA